jgi:hypothetical protein
MLPFTGIMMSLGGDRGGVNVSVSDHMPDEYLSALAPLVPAVEKAA